MTAAVFLFLSYFGSDQSQVQRYLSGQTLTQSRMGLIMNGFLKIPMQFIILFIGVMVFVFFQFNPVPLHFNPINKDAVDKSIYAEDYNSLPNVSGAIAVNEAAYLAFIINNPGLFSSPATSAEVQAMITAVNASQSVLAQIGNEGDSPNTVTSVISITVQTGNQWESPNKCCLELQVGLKVKQAQH